MALDKALIASFEKQSRAYLKDAARTVHSMQNSLSEKDYKVVQFIEQAKWLHYTAGVLAALTERWGLLEGESSMAWEDDRWIAEDKGNG